MNLVVAFDDRIVLTYLTYVDVFRKGWITSVTLAILIYRTIMPELQAADARVKALEKVPLEHQPLVASAEEYLRLRSESWLLRAEVLRKTNMPTPHEAGRTDWESSTRSRLRAGTQHRANGIMRGMAEGRERASLEALER